MNGDHGDSEYLEEEEPLSAAEAEEASSPEGFKKLMRSYLPACAGRLRSQLASNDVKISQAALFKILELAGVSAQPNQVGSQNAFFIGPEYVGKLLEGLGKLGGALAPPAGLVAGGPQGPAGPGRGGKEKPPEVPKVPPRRKAPR